MTTQGATLVLDLDGTLYEWEGKPDYTREGILTKCVAIPEARRRVAEAAAAGWRVFGLTGRSPGTANATRCLMYDDYPDLYESKTFFVGEDGRWIGWDAYKHRKVARLESLGPNVVYVGDRQEDAECAALAGVGFLPAELWRQGAPYVHLLPLLGCGTNANAEPTLPTLVLQEAATIRSDSDSEVGA